MLTEQKLFRWDVEKPRQRLCRNPGLWGAGAAGERGQAGWGESRVPLTGWCLVPQVRGSGV